MEDKKTYRCSCGQELFYTWEGLHELVLFPCIERRWWNFWRHKFAGYKED